MKGREGDAPCAAFAGELRKVGRGPADPQLAAHLASCQHCSSYVAVLDALEGFKRAGFTAKEDRKKGTTRKQVAVAAGVLAVASAALGYLFDGSARSGGDEAAMATAVATPSAQLVIRRGGESFLWNGSAPANPHDTIMLRVSCEGRSHLTVAVPGSAGVPWTRLEDGQCPTGPAAAAALTLLVDDSPGDEQFVAIMSRGWLDNAALEGAANLNTRNDDLWTVRFDLPKVGARPR
jgi:hypothetical protein